MRRGITTVGLVAFLLLDVVLVYLALRPPAAADRPTSTVAGAASSTPSGQGGSSRPASSDDPTGDGSDTEPSPGPSTEGEGAAQPVHVLLAGLDGDMAWRATTGDCEAGGATLEFSDDGGASWQEVSSPAATISRVQPLSSGRGFIVGAEDGCGQSEFSTADGGATWVGPRQLVGGWARKLDVPSEVLTPQSAAASPCGGGPVLDLSRTSAEQAEALCQDGSVMVTNDGGLTWGDSGSAEGAVALSNRLEDEVLATYAARTGITGCDGVEIVRVTLGQDPARVSCVEVNETPSGLVAISVGETAGWLAVGDQTWVAGAGLDEWVEA